MNSDAIQSRHATENAAKQKQNGSRKSIDARSMTAVTDSVAAKKAQAQQEIKDMMNKLKLVEDDVKGAAVDQGI